MLVQRRDTAKEFSWFDATLSHLEDASKHATAGKDPEVSSDWTAWRTDGELTVPPWLSGSSAAANQCWPHSGCPGRSRWRPKPRWLHAHVNGSDLREDRRRMESSPPAILICCMCLSGQHGLTFSGCDSPYIFILQWLLSEFLASKLCSNIQAASFPNLERWMNMLIFLREKNKKLVGKKTVFRFWGARQQRPAVSVDKYNFSRIWMTPMLNHVST